MGTGAVVVVLIIGAIAGFLAGRVMRGRGFGLPGNILIGVAGAVLAGFVAPLFGLGFVGFVGAVVRATIGAVLLLAVMKVVRRV